MVKSNSKYTQIRVDLLPDQQQKYMHKCHTKMVSVETLSNNRLDAR